MAKGYNQLSESFLKQICGDAEVEYCLYNPRNKSGIQTWEIKVRNTDNTRKVVIVRDYGYKIDHEEIQIHPFTTRSERNEEILRLYNDVGLSQIFLGNLFNMSQPSISLIVNGKSIVKEVQCKK